jgi:NTE family protein
MRHIPIQAFALFLSLVLAVLVPVSSLANIGDGHEPVSCFALRPIAVFKVATEDNAAGSKEVDPEIASRPQYIKAKSSSSECQKGSIDASNGNAEGKTTGNEESLHRPKIALALGGGGARGAAHVGVLKVLEREGIKVDYIVGTSMGAIVGGLYSAGVPLSALENSFNTGSLMKSYMTVPLTWRLAAAPLLLVARLVHSPYDGLYKGNKFRKYLIKLMPDGNEKIEELKPPFRPVALNVVDGKAYALSEGQLSYALQASSAVPGLRKPVEIDNTLYVDGGVVANLPVEQAKKMGADIVIAVNVDERVNDVPLDVFRKVGSIAQRVVLLQLANSDEAQAALADIVIHPNVDGIGLISTRSADTRKAMKEGESAAQLAIPAIKETIAKVQAEKYQRSN